MLRVIREVTMKRNITNCRHSLAYPTIIADVAGFMWCPDCGAHRLINRVNDGAGYEYAHRGWIYPTGHEDVCKQIDAIGERKEP